MDDQIQSFLDAIRAQPADDGPRLLFADWLDERGDPWGEFIRVQCALASSSLSASDRKRLADREEFHLKFGAPQRHAAVHRMLHGHGLVNHFSHRRGPLYRWVERRGLIAEIEVDADYFAKNASIVSRIGAIETVRVRKLNDAALVERLRGVYELQAISQFDLRHPSNDLNLSRQLVKSRPPKADLLPERQERYIDQRSTWPRFVSDIIRNVPAPSPAPPPPAPPRPQRPIPEIRPEFRPPQPVPKPENDDSLMLGIRIVVALTIGFGGLWLILLIYGMLESSIHQAAMR